MVGDRKKESLSLSHEPFEGGGETVWRSPGLGEGRLEICPGEGIGLNNPYEITLRDGEGNFPVSISQGKFHLAQRSRGGAPCTRVSFKVRSPSESSKDM